MQDAQRFEGEENEERFFTTQERQWLVLRLLESIRAKLSDRDALPGVVLLEGQPIGMDFKIIYLIQLYCIVMIYCSTKMYICWYYISSVSIT